MAHDKLEPLVIKEHLHIRKLIIGTAVLAATLLTLFAKSANAQELDPIANLTQTEIPTLLLPPEPKLEPKEPTTEEKIKSNFYKCNTDIQWIRADNAQCLNKAVVSTNTPAQSENKPEPIKSKPQSDSTGLNGYAYPSCTGYVASRRHVPPGWGDASSWRQGAINAGWTVSSTPVPGAIGWRYGHVVFVESVNPDGSVTISENNYDWNGSTRTITISPSQYQYLY